MSVDPQEFAKRLIEEAKKEAERIIEEAKKKAEEILLKAQEEADKIRKQKESEAKAKIRATANKIIGTEKRKARIEVSMKRRELVDKAVEMGIEKAKERINKEILERRLEDAMKLEANRKRLEGPEYLKDKAASLGLEFVQKDIHGFRLYADDITIDETVESRAERRLKKLEAIAAEEILGRRVRL